MKAFSVLVFIAALAGAAIAAETPPGASSCSGCHANSASAETPVPKITGRAPDEIMAAMAAFRTGGKKATVMDRIAKGFTDDELKPIAAWLAAQK